MKKQIPHTSPDFSQQRPNPGHFFRSAAQLTLRFTVSLLLLAFLDLVLLIGGILLPYNTNLFPADTNSFTYAMLRSPLNVLDHGLLHSPKGDWEISPDARQLLASLQLWAVLMNDQGDVVWSYHQPSDIPNHYSLRDGISFSRWYLNDYPVLTRIRDDGILVLGYPKNSAARWQIMFAPSEFPYYAALVLIIFLFSILWLITASFHFVRKEFRQRDAARREWIAAVSHDVRTPLSAILGYSSSLCNNAALPAPLQQEAAFIQEKGLELRELIEDLNMTNYLTYSMEALELQPVFPAKLLRKIAADYMNEWLCSAELSADACDAGDAPARKDPSDPAFSALRFRIQLAIAPITEGIALSGSEAILSRMLRNLIGNSIRHNPAGCLITLELSMQKRHLVLVVSDNGCGFSKKELQRLAEKKPEVVPGHGLGLTVVRQGAAALRAQIRFSNNKDGGSRCEMSFHFPRIR